MRKLLILCAVCLLLVFPLVANATSISVNSSDWSDSRSTGNGITAYDGWSGSGNDGFKISWNITYDDSLYYSYEYTISNAVGGDLVKKLSNWILEVSAGSVADDFESVIPYFSVNDDGSEESPKQWDPTGNDKPRPYMPAGGIYGLKWDTVGDPGTFTVSFDTKKDPVWGDFYAVDGSEDAVWATAYNIGFGIDLTNVNTDNFTNFTNWIATPNGGSIPPLYVIPEPATMLLLGSGLIGFAVSGKKRFKKRVCSRK